MSDRLKYLYRELVGLAGLLEKPNPYRPDLLLREWERVAVKYVVTYFTEIQKQDTPAAPPVKLNRHQRRAQLVRTRKAEAELRKDQARKNLLLERVINEINSKQQVAEPGPQEVEEAAP